jgi:hypothetical protein
MGIEVSDCADSGDLNAGRSLYEKYRSGPHLACADYDVTTAAGAAEEATHLPWVDAVEGIIAGDIE